jgi:hypothetical protein|tara:strand:+ start:1097 stop:1318 length:222 start_codon:yes stop_codon:yes gene_type:complete
MKLSNQAMGALMMALQKSIMEQSDITGLLKELDFSVDENEQLVVANPPLVRLMNQEDEGETIMPREEDPYGNA